eukprot:TRINITY_DN851_c0_g2_i5.p3 TRINITY_DN851_c0_g2~~TRINITY_DN851_c0_g2_i5.p3  ORF type:complete len:222 (-),score=-9.71 TRINITY_DN851_c0_g2_i5:681-1346(-)
MIQCTGNLVICGQSKANFNNVFCYEQCNMLFIVWVNLFSLFTRQFEHDGKNCIKTEIRKCMNMSTYVYMYVVCIGIIYIFVLYVLYPLPRQFFSQFVVRSSIIWKFFPLLCMDYINLERCYRDLGHKRRGGELFGKGEDPNWGGQLFKTNFKLVFIYNQLSFSSSFYHLFDLLQAKNFLFHQEIMYAYGTVFLVGGVFPSVHPSESAPGRVLFSTRIPRYF